MSESPYTKIQELIQSHIMLLLLLPMSPVLSFPNEDPSFSCTYSYSLVLLLVTSQSAPLSDNVGDRASCKASQSEGVCERDAGGPCEGEVEAGVWELFSL